MTFNTPGDTKQDVNANPYVYEREDANFVYAWDHNNKLAGIKKETWEKWSVVRSAKQVGLFE